jgi:hypothetical protein
MPSRRKRHRARRHRGEIRARFRVRCNGKLHWILLTDQGRLVLKEHDNLDAEHVLTAMSGETCRCVQIHKQWCTFVKHGTTTMRLAELPRELQPWAEDAHKRHQLGRVLRKSLQEASRAHFLASTNGDLKALKLRITREIKENAEDHAATIIKRCKYELPPHVYPIYSEPNISIGTRSLYAPTPPTIDSYDDSIMSHQEGFAEYGVKRRLSLTSYKPIGICWAMVMTGGTARDPSNNTRVAVIDLERPKSHALRADQEIAYAGRQNTVTSVIRTQKCLLHRNGAGWEVAEWLPDKKD